MGPCTGSEFFVIGSANGSCRTGKRERERARGGERDRDRQKEERETETDKKIRER